VRLPSADQAPARSALPIHHQLRPAQVQERVLLDTHAYHNPFFSTGTTLFSRQPKSGGWPSDHAAQNNASDRLALPENNWRRIPVHVLTADVLLERGSASNSRRTSLRTALALSDLKQEIQRAHVRAR